MSEQQISDHRFPWSRIMVTGGAGLIGSHLTYDLLRRGCDVTVLDDFSSGTIENLKKTISFGKLKIVKGDINDRDIVKKHLIDMELVFHEAAVGTSVQEEALINHVNVSGTNNLVDCAESSRVERFVFSSSSMVYGSPSAPRVDEKSPTVPTTAEGRSKLEAERLCLLARSDSGLSTVILRFFDVYGPPSRSGPFGRILWSYAQKLFVSESPTIHGTGKQNCDPLYVDDAVRASVLAAANQKQPHLIFNVSGGHHETFEDLALLFSKIVIGKNVIIPLNYQPLEDSTCGIYTDISFARRELGFYAEVELEVGLKAYFDWFKREVTRAAYKLI